MGNANCSVHNLSNQNALILTFNNADLLYLNYKEKYKIIPKSIARVEAAADSWGLKVAVVYDSVGDTLMYRRWDCANRSTLTLHSVSGADIRASGCRHIGLGTISTSEDTANDAREWLKPGVTMDLGDWDRCSGSKQCRNECCSGDYSNGVLKCTPLNGGYRSDMCVGPPPIATSNLGDWRFCSTSDECQNGCCSGHYTNGVAKCTPLNGGYSPDICVPPGPDARYLRVGGEYDKDPLN